MHNLAASQFERNTIQCVYIKQNKQHIPLLKERDEKENISWIGRYRNCRFSRWRKGDGPGILSKCFRKEVGCLIWYVVGGIADVFDVRENPDLKKFDHLVIGSAIRMAKITPELQVYLEKNGQWIGPKVRGLYTVCGNMRQPVTPEVTKQQITDYLAPLCGAKDATGRVFLGRVTPKLLPPDVREQMSMMGEYDNLKRPDCMAFGSEILSRMGK
jgi:hypothetical protein